VLKNAKLQLLTILFLFILLFSVQISAEEEVELYKHDVAPITHFSAAINGEKTACSCSPYNDILYVNNPGTVPQTYYIEIKGSAKDFITLSQNGFILEPGESSDVYIYGNVPCNANGDYTLELELYGSLDGSILVSQEIHVVECSSGSMYTDYSAFSACPCTPITYTINLANSQAKTEIYQLYVEDVDPDHYVFSKNPVIIGSGESEEIFLYVNKPCYVFGEFDHNVIARASSTQKEITTPIRMEILRACYGYNMGISELFDVSGLKEVNLSFGYAEDLEFATCENTTNVLLVKFGNPSDIINSYVLEVESNIATPWVTMPVNTVTLASEQEYILPVFFTPTLGSAGDYIIALDGKTSRGDIHDVVPIEFEVVDCIGLEKETNWINWIVLLIVLLLILLGLLLLLLAARPSDETETTKATKVKEKTKSTGKGAPIWLPLLFLLILLIFLVGFLSWPIVNDKYQERLAGEVCADDLNSDLLEKYYDWQNYDTSPNTNSNDNQERIDELQDELDSLEEQLTESVISGDVSLLNFLTEEINEREDELAELGAGDSSLISDEDNKEALENAFNTALEENNLTLEEFEEILNKECSQETLESYEELDNKYPLWLTLPLVLLIPLLLLLLFWLFKRRKKQKTTKKETFAVKKTKDKGPSKTRQWFGRWWKWLLLLLLLLLLIGGVIFAQVQYNAFGKAADKASSTGNRAAAIADDNWNELMDAIGSKKENQGLLEELQERIENLAEENRELKDYLEGDAEEREKDIEDIEEELEELNEAISELELEEVNYNEVQDKLDNIEININILKQELNNTNFATEEGLESLENLIETHADETSQEITNLEEYIAALEQEYEQQDQENLEDSSQTEQLITELQEQVEILDDEVEELGTEIDDTKENLAVVEEVAYNNEQEIKLLWDELLVKEKEAQDLEDELLEKIEEAFELGEENQEAISELDERLDALEQEVRNIQIELDVIDALDYTEYIGDLSEDVEEIKDMIDELQKEETVPEEDAEVNVTTAEEMEALEEVPTDYITVVVIDISMSGLVEEQGVSRFDIIKEKTLTYINQGGKINYILVGKNPIIARKNIDKFQATQFIQRLQPMDDQSRIGDGILLAKDDIIKDDPGRIVVFSDFVNTLGTDPYEAKAQVEDEDTIVVFYDVVEYMPSAQEETETEVIDDETDEDETTSDIEDTTETEEPVFVIENEIIDETDEEKQLVIEFEENTIFILDLYDYFKDADRDVLTFTATDMENVKTEIHNNIMTLKPDKRWVGEEEFTVTADDGRGGVVTSPTIVAKVSDLTDSLEDGEPMDWTLIWWILGLIILLALIIGFYVWRALSTEDELEDLPEEEPKKKGKKKK
jgi:hypothetical protein